MTARKPPDRVFAAFRATAVGGGMIVPGDRVLAAVSGGPDSVALVVLLLRLREEMPLEVRLAHFNHRLRDEAGADQDFVRDLARRWVLPLAVDGADVRAYAARRRLNLEEAGRDLRYRFLRRAAAESGATKIATGHTMTDQAETVLMRLMRGTGLSGLAGIAPVVAGPPCPVVRPLLAIAGPDLRAWLAARGLSWREDATNLDRRYLRNRIRAELLPLVARDYEPRIVEHLARLAGIVREDDELLHGFVRELADEFILRRGRDLSLDLKTLPLLLPALARRVAREFLREAAGGLRDISFDDVAALLALGEGKELTLRQGLTLRRESGRVGLKKKARAPRPYETSWDGRGDLRLPAAGLVLRGRLRRSGGPGRPLRKDDRAGADLDADSLAFPLAVRSRRPGDLYRPLGAPGRKKLKEILRAKGVAAAGRDRLPVLLSRGEIVWVPGLPVAERCKVTDSTVSVLSIRVLKKAGRPAPSGGDGSGTSRRSAGPRSSPRRPPGR
ncbi:MAG TPA: tRNA lysidine(34) synthetase TilS [Candidatus Aminicenantes bacterium]|nr:tRNA lysidine(34) synthetase TilS [Candidatus Aminicenantes bacterium]HRY64694.1 tRNA lysidine(34) synthetase TilS [Candidatus Aminicenantes bacterium]HRZ71607.1 tRNA lysidine(34) synthetase TilS [Candidatus Aminicenantes bacterium]